MGPAPAADAHLACRPFTIKRLGLLLPLLALGPVTGPLLGLAAVSFAHRRPLIGTLALAGIAAFWLGAPALLAAEIALLRTH